MRYFVLAGAFLALFGCGGGGGAMVASPFVGTWAGDWTSVPADTGTFNLTINSSGSFTGQTVDNGIGDSGTLSGSVTNNGNVTATVSYPGEPSYRATGQFALNAQGEITGTVSATMNGQTASDSFTLDKQ